MLTDLKNRGVADIFIACVDGLTGFPKAIETVFPLAQVQLCIVHQVRASLNYVSWKQRKAVDGDLQTIYRASTAEDANCKLEEFAKKWDGAYPTISQMWRRNWEHVTPFFAYPDDIRKVIYTTLTGDAAFYSAKNEAAAIERGVKRVCLPNRSTKSNERKLQQKKRWFRNGQKCRTGCEGRISLLKRRHGLTRCRYKGHDGMKRWVGLGVIADNLINAGRFLSKRPEK